MTPPIFIAKRGALTSNDKRALRAAGYVVATVESMGDVRLLRPESDLDGGDILGSALKALAHGDKHTSAIDLRDAFTRNVAALYEGKLAAKKSGFPRTRGSE